MSSSSSSNSNTDWKEYEKFLNLFEKVFTKMGMWPSRQLQPTRFIVLSIFIIFCIITPIKIIRNPERESFENSIVNGFGCFMAALFMIRLTLSEEHFINVFDFIRKDLKAEPSAAEKEILVDICGYMRTVKKFVTLMIPLGITSKLCSPFVQYSIDLITEGGNNVSLSIPPAMAIPRMSFLYYDEYLIYVMECIVRIMMLMWLISAAFMFAVSSLYFGAQFRLLAVELENVSIDDEEIFEGYIKRHEEISSITKQLTNVYNIHLLAECIVTYINLALLLLSMFAGSESGKFLDMMNDMLLTLTGGSQFVFVIFFGAKLMDASLTVLDGACNCDWVGKSVVQQKKLKFLIARAQKPSKLSVTDNFITASLEFMMNLIRDSYAAFNILKTTVGN